MHEAVQEDRWNHTAAIRMEIHNAAFGRKRAKQFREMHPMTRKRKSRLDKKKSARLLDSVFGAWKNG
jgi:hypothetical protein